MFRVWKLWLWNWKHRLSHSHLQLSAVTLFFPLSHLDLLRSDHHPSLEIQSSWFCPSMPDLLVTAVKPMHIASQESQWLVRTPPSHRKSNEAGTRSLGSWWRSRCRKGSLCERTQRSHGRRARCTHHPRDPRLARCRRCWCCWPRSAPSSSIPGPSRSLRSVQNGSWRLANQLPGEQRNIPNEVPQRSQT